MVGGDAHGTENRHGTGHRHRHLQLSGLEPVGRSVGRTAAIDALSGQHLDPHHGRTTGRDRPAPAGRRAECRFPRCESDRLSGNRRPDAHPGRHRNNNHPVSTAPRTTHRRRSRHLGGTAARRFAEQGGHAGIHDRPAVHAAQPETPRHRSPGGLSGPARSRTGRHAAYAGRISGHALQPRPARRLRPLCADSDFGPGDRLDPLPARVHRRHARLRTARSRTLVAAHGGTLPRKDAGQNVPDPAALLARIHVAHPTRNRRSVAGNQTGRHPRHQRLPRGRPPDMERPRRRMDRPANGHAPHRRRKLPGASRSRRTGDR